MLNMTFWFSYLQSRPQLLLHCRLKTRLFQLFVAISLPAFMDTGMYLISCVNLLFINYLFWSEL